MGDTPIHLPLSVLAGLSILSSCASPPATPSADSDESDSTLQEVVDADSDADFFIDVPRPDYDDAPQVDVRPELRDTVEDTIVDATMTEDGTGEPGPFDDTADAAWPQDALAGEDLFDTAVVDSESLADVGPTPGDSGLEGDLDSIAPNQPLLEMVLIPAGGFLMGSPADELGRFPESEEQVSVTITSAFWLQTTEMTQSQWTLVSGGDNPSSFIGDGDSPIENISWWSAIAFLNELSIREARDPCYRIPSGCRGRWQNGTLDCGYDSPNVATDDGDIRSCPGYRLPTEAEWEYAARSGTTTATYFGNITDITCADTTLLDIAWFCGNSEAESHAVALKLPNNFGLYDMLGNVWEWTWDVYVESLPGGVDPAVSGPGQQRVNRGGWSGNPARRVRAARRNGSEPERAAPAIGFRAAMSSL